MNRHSTAVFAVFAIIAGAAPVVAQDPILALNPTTMIGYAGTTAGNAYAQRRVGTRLTQRQPTRSTVNPAQVIARTGFRPDPRVRNQVYARTVAQVRKVSPPEAAKLRQLLVSGSFHTQAAAYLARYGMSANNLVDTTSLYLASAWYASRGSSADPTPAQMRGLRRQVAMAMAATPESVNASNALKQEVAEASIIQAMFVGSLANEAARNPAAAGPLRAAAVRGAKASYQIDLSRMNLTANGLR